MNLSQEDTENAEMQVPSYASILPLQQSTSSPSNAAITSAPSVLPLIQTDSPASSDHPSYKPTAPSLSISNQTPILSIFDDNDSNTVPETLQSTDTTYSPTSSGKYVLSDFASLLLVVFSFAVLS